MALISLRNISLRFGPDALLDDVGTEIQPRERIGLLGRNGAGKTTLLRIIGGELPPDSGVVRRQAGCRVASLSQDVPQGLTGSVRSVVVAASADTDEDAWATEHAGEQVLSRMSLDGEARFETLSAGMKRRVLLARALAARPSVLLLDEPTNHLDIEAIDWLERFLVRFEGSLVFVTHDRAFLRRIATRILEIDRSRLFDWSCDYDTFLRRKEKALADEDRQNAEFDKKLAREEVWVRQGIKARRTRNEGRVRALVAMRKERSERRASAGQGSLTIAEGQRSGRLVAALDKVSFAYGDHAIVRDFSTMIMRGDKVGILGHNGAGKTTLLRLMLGQLEPTAGGVRLGSNLQIAYFDQLRDQLDPEATVQENVGQGYDTIEVDGRQRHIMGYLQDFLFSPDRARSKVRVLSGGERNRVLLARLFAKPANVIVLDEPTNDLDTETLELLEERLVPFPGAVLIVSHDREFLNNVVSSTIAFERPTDDGPEQPVPKEYVGGYDDWVRARAQAAKPTTAPREEKPRTKEAPRRLGYMQQRELKSLPGRIEKLEQEIAKIHDQLSQPEFYQQPPAKVTATNDRLAQLQEDLAQAYARWEELDG